jgi:regulator of nonsense transcripts 1
LIEEQDQLRIILERNEGHALGLAGAYSSTGELAMLAVADASTIIIIDFELKNSENNNHQGRPASPPSATDNTAVRQVLTESLLRRSVGFLHAFDIAPLALALFRTLGLRVANAIDMQCAGPPSTRAPLTTVKQAIGDLYRVYDCNVKDIFFTDTITEHHPGGPPTTNKFTTPLALRAWITHHLSQLASMEERLAQVPPVDTFRLSDIVSHSCFLVNSGTDHGHRR